MSELLPLPALPLRIFSLLDLFLTQSLLSPLALPSLPSEVQVPHSDLEVPKTAICLVSLAIVQDPQSSGSGEISTKLSAGNWGGGWCIFKRTKIPDVLQVQNVLFVRTPCSNVKMFLY